jgi:hypothetical protein
MNALYDVVAVSLATYHIRLMATQASKPDAEAIVTMAVMRRGCDTEFFTSVPQGTYQDGDQWDCASEERLSEEGHPENL